MDKGHSTVVVSREDAILAVFASTIIDAPALVVFNHLSDAANYPAWNSLTTKVIIHSQPQGVSPESQILHVGTIFIFDMVMDASKPKNIMSLQLRISDISTPDKPSDYVSQELLSDGTFAGDPRTTYRIAWTIHGGLISMGMSGERFHEIIPIDENKCEVRTWENQSGIMARPMKWMYGEILKIKVQDWCADLKKYSER
jgi:hypothetical protein